MAVSVFIIGTVFFIKASVKNFCHFIIINLLKYKLIILKTTHGTIVATI